MNWNRRYAIKSYLLSTVWTAPVIALLLEQATYRIAYLYQLDFGGIPGFVLEREGTLAVADYVVASSIVFIVFTFSSLLVALQVASGQLTPRIIATALLRDKAIRRSVALFVYALLLAVAVKARVDTVPRFLVSLMGILGLVCVVVFMFLIDYAARLLRPVSIMSRIAQQGFKVVDDVYPRPISTSSVPCLCEKRPPALLHRGTSDRDRGKHRQRGGGEGSMSLSSWCRALAILLRMGSPCSVAAATRQQSPSQVYGQVAFDRERTMVGDSTFAFG